MKSFTLTVFTETISATGFIPRFKSLARPLKSLLGTKPPAPKKYGGHYAVTRSLVEGLQKTGVAFNYNPPVEKDIAEKVIVLSGVERLKEMIELKKRGRIKVLLAGPNVVDDVRSEDQLVADPAIDCYIVPSQWVKDMAVEDCPALRGRVRCWSAGIDTEYWKPGFNEERSKVLVYWKSEPEEFYEHVVQALRAHELKHETIKYGSYTVGEYKEQLNRATFAIFISRSESQGIALAEAWSMDVPTLVFDPKEFSFNGRVVRNVSSCPYLDNTVGATWKHIEELKLLLHDRKAFNRFAPRQYVLKQFTDEHSAKQLIKLFDN